MIPPLPILPPVSVRTSFFTRPARSLSNSLFLTARLTGGLSEKFFARFVGARTFQLGGVNFCAGSCRGCLRVFALSIKDNKTRTRLKVELIEAPGL
jgi:hypothetical protein